MSAQPLPRLTPAEYLAQERAAEHRSESLAGEVFAMAGTSRWHNLISVNVAARLHAQLSGRPCEVYSADMRVKVAPTGLYAYPDVVLACSDPTFEDSSADTLLNPTIIFEILSPSTEAFDRGEKFSHYRRLGSLTDYLLISQDRPRVERYHRQEGGFWLFSEIEGLDARLVIESIGVELPLHEIYERVELPAE
ncbi:MAG: Uma2 family endonuclease [Thermoanaerobaculia bacterium]|nr:Uma2 family endonuclease [Thermoanaerobaculia bacterium]